MRRVVPLLVVSLAASSILAIEPKSDLALELRVVDMGRGVARIEVALDAFRNAEDVELTIERAGGRALGVRPTWKSAGGTEIVRGARGIVVPARGRIVTLLEVPIEGEGVVVRAKARAGDGEVATEAFVPLGASRVVVEDGVANFRVKEAN